MRVAAIDCGTNSIRLLIADIRSRPGGGTRLHDVVRLMRVVRLGQGVDATGVLDDQALKRTFDAVDEYAALISENSVEQVRFVATSATRDARNRQDFVTGIIERLGVKPEVISGGEEAALSFAGAASVLGREHPAPILVVDLGGGSTEFVLGDRSGVSSSCSADIGCVRLTERHLHDNPPTEQQLSAATADVDAAIDHVLGTVPLGEAACLVGVAGSITTVTAHALRLDSYQPEAIHGAELSLDDAAGAATELLGMSTSERAALPFMHPGRVDVIGAGALIWWRILERVGELSAGRVRTAITSEHDILDGIALGIAPG